MIWKDSISIAKSIYLITKKFPASEQYGLTSQLNRAAVSVPSNIAEGSGRASNKEFVHFLGISMGSCFEIETQLIIANEIGYLQKSDLQKIQPELSSLQKMINTLISTLRKRSNIKYPI